MSSERSVQFTDCFEDISRGVTKIKQKDCLPYGDHPVIDQGQEPIAGYSNGEGGLCTDVPAIVFGDHTRCVKYVTSPFFAGADGVKILKPKDSRNIRYWFHYLRSRHIENLGYSRHYKLLKQCKFKVRPIEEQELISTRLDNILQLIDVETVTLDMLDELVKSRFIEMFGKTDNFQQVPLSECVSSIDSGKSPKCATVPRSGNQPAVLKLSAISSGSYDERENKALLPDEQIVQSKEVEAGDILMTRKNTPELVGMCVLVRGTEGNIMFPDLVFRMHPIENVDGTYLSGLLSGPLFHKVREMAHGSAKSMSNIPKSELGGLMIPVPPLALQQQFADFVAKVDKLEFETRQAIDKLQLLYDSLAQEYFGD